MKLKYSLILLRKEKKFVTIETSSRPLRSFIKLFFVMSPMRRQITPATRYYIRKLLQQNLDRLTFPLLDNTGTRADATTHLREILASLYVKESKVDSMMLELERLALMHQSLHQSSVNQQDLQKTEAQIFGLLGCEVKASFLETLTIGFQFTHR
jgi:hypothetical protein